MLADLDILWSSTNSNTVPVKGKLTVSRVSILVSRDLILDSQFQESSLASSFENFEDRESSFESRN